MAAHCVRVAEEGKVRVPAGTRDGWLGGIAPSCAQSTLTSVMAELGHTDSLGCGIDAGAGGVGVVLTEGVIHREAQRRGGRH